MVAFGRLLLCEFVKKQDLFKLKWRFLDLIAHRGELDVKTSNVVSLEGDFYRSI